MLQIVSDLQCLTTMVFTWYIHFLGVGVGDREAGERERNTGRKGRRIQREYRGITCNNGGICEWKIPVQQNLDNKTTLRTEENWS